MSKKNTNNPALANKSTQSLTGFKFAGKTIVISKEDKICYLLLMLLLIIAYNIRSNFFTIPFERDEGIYVYFGNLILEGKIPYRDFIEAKFPGIFYFYALMVKLFGYNLPGIHFGFTCLNLLSAVFIYFASRNLFSPIAGLISTTTFLFVSLTPNLSGFTVQSEHGVAFFTSLAFLFYSLIKLYNKWVYYFLMGLCLGAAVLIKTNAVFLVAWGCLILFSDFIFTKEYKFKTFIYNALSFAGGGILIVGFLFLFMYSKGVFSDMIRWAYEHPKNYVSAMPYEEGKKYFIYTRDAIVEHYKFFWIHAILALLVTLPKTINIKFKILAYTLLGASFLTIVPGFFFYGHYWIQTIPGLALIAGLTFHSIQLLLVKVFKIADYKISYSYLIIFSLLTISHVMANKAYYFHPNYERILRTVYGNNPFPESMEIANYINSHSKPEDGLVLIGSEPQIYFYTNKKCPSRFAYFTALVNNVPEHKEWQREFVRDVEAAKPKYFVFFNHQFSLLVQPNTDKYVFEWSNKYIAENYKLVGLVDMVDGYSTANYVWNESLNNFKPQGQSQIYVYERKI